MAHQCDLCDAMTTVLDGFLTQLDDGLRAHLSRGPVDVGEVVAKLDEQRAHVLAAVAVWWVRESMRLFRDDVKKLENCLANAFHENGILVYEPSITKSDGSEEGARE